MIIVTGATGFLGNALTRRLADAVGGRESALKPPLKALVRERSDKSSLAGLEIEYCSGDTSDLDSLVEAFRGADAVFHVAGMVSISARGNDKLHAINVEGTKNVLEACRLAEVGRLVYVSSIHAFVEPPMGTCAHEGLPIDPARVRGVYAQTKARATQMVLDAVRSGLDAVVVYPTGVLGPYDFRPSPTGQGILDCARRRLGAYVDGAYNFVDVRDVAEGALSACLKGRPGEGYLLSGNVVTVPELLKTVAEISGVPAPRLRLNFGFARAVSHLMPLYYRIVNKQPVFTTYSLDTLKSNCCISHDKAARELGYAPRPFRETIKDTIAWFREQGMLPPASTKATDSRH